MNKRTIGVFLTIISIFLLSTVKVDIKATSEQKAAGNKEVLNATNDETWLQNKIDTIENNGIIILSGDIVLTEAIKLPAKSFTIDGNNHSITLDVNYHGKHFITSGIGTMTHTFKNLVLIGHNTGDPGKTNQQRIVGGGIEASGFKGQTIIFDKSSAMGIHDTTNGSVVTLKNSTFIAKDSTIIQNSSNANGGAIAMNNGRVEIYDSVISNNSSYQGAGGALYIPYGDGGYVYRSTFNDNYAFKEGGAIASVNSVSIAYIESSEFYRNTTSGSGGAIALSGVMTIKKTDFIENCADKDGGAVYQWNDIANIDSNSYIDSKFIRNTAKGGAGGAIYVENRSFEKLKANNVVFSGNRATKDGLNWDVNSPKSSPFFSPSFDQHSLAKHYQENVLNISSFSSAIDENIKYTNIFNNHDVNYDVSSPVFFYDETMQKYEHTGRDANALLNRPEPLTNDDDRVFMGWKLMPDERYNTGWIPDDWDLSVPYMWDEATMRVNGIVFLVEVWANKYEITYHLNDGTGKTTTIPYITQSTIMVPSLTTVNNNWVALEGMEFIGWAMDPVVVADEIVYQTNDILDLNGNINLYARYKTIELPADDQPSEDDPVENGVNELPKTGVNHLSQWYLLGLLCGCGILTIIKKEKNKI